jgi:RNA polymerase sigma-70 factor (ECF subfamily)
VEKVAPRLFLAYLVLCMDMKVRKSRAAGLAPLLEALFNTTAMVWRLRLHMATASRTAAGDPTPRAREQGDDLALDGDLVELLEEHGAAIYRLAISIVRDPAIAEDVVQETLIKAWQALPAFRGESSVRRWILTIAHNTAVSVLRATREDAHDPHTIPDRPASESLEHDAQSRLAVEQLWDALDELDGTSRALILLREIEGLSYDELSNVTRLPMSTIKTRLFRARKVLAAALEEWRT